MSGIQTKKGLATLLQRDYQFDHVGNIGTMTTQAGETLYGYDDIYQLTVADHPQETGLADESFSYDRVGNRLTSAATNGSWSHNQNNELTDTTVASYEYDANGNTVKMTVGTQVTRYEYNARNRLAQVILPSGQVANYSYDPFGRRARKQVDSAATWYVYAEEGLVGEYSASGSMQKVYGWMPDGTWGTDPLYMRDGSGLYFYHNDHLGTPQRLTSAASGAVVWGAGYAALGKAEIDPLSTVENNLRFPGQYFDAETGLHYNFQRTYDPETGRYTQVDPIGFAGGDVNLYRYVRNNVSGFADRFGLDSYSDNVARATAGADLALTYLDAGKITTPAQATFFAVGVLTDKASIGLSFAEDSGGKAVTGVGLGVLSTAAAVGGGSLLGSGLSGYGLGTSINGLYVYGSDQTIQDWWSDAIWEKVRGKHERRMNKIYEEHWRTLKQLSPHLKDLKEINEMMGYYNYRMGGNIKVDCK